jgi:hypothetical protein
MSCSIFNSAPFQTISFGHASNTGEAIQVLVVKGTWTLSSGRLATTQNQTPIHMRDETIALQDLNLEPVQRQSLAGREQDLWLRYESDLVPPKPCFDLIVNAWAQDKGQPFFEILCGVLFQARSLAGLVARAPRAWGYGVLTPAIKSAGAPVSKVPVFNVFAFGGPANRRAVAAGQNHPPAAKPKQWPANQDGMGYCTNPIKAVGVSLPWLEAPDHPISHWKDRPPVAALGHLSRADQPRLALQGSMDKSSRTLPDFDPRHFNAAPPALQLTQKPKPGDKVELINLSRDGYCAFTFPGLRLRAMGEERGGRRLAPVDLRWDTLLVEPEQDSATLVWRAELPDPARKLASITLMVDTGAAA